MGPQMHSNIPYTPTIHVRGDTEWRAIFDLVKEAKVRNVSPSLLIQAQGWIPDTESSAIWRPRADNDREPMDQK